MAQRLPTPGGDTGQWGTILNDFLNVEHDQAGNLKIRSDGTLQSKANDNSVVHLTGDETISGVKTFSSSPVIPTPSSNLQAATKAYVDTAVIGSGGAPASARIFNVYESELTPSLKSIDQIQAAINSAASWLSTHQNGHAIVRVNYENVVDWESNNNLKFLRWPKGCPGLLEIDGTGSTIRFTDVSQGILCAYTDTPTNLDGMTEYITYGDLWLHGFTIDANNTTGQQAILFGTIYLGTQQIRQSFGKVHLSDNHATNIVQDRATGLHRPFVWFGLRAQATNDTAITVRKVLLEDMGCDGGNGYWLGGVAPRDGDNLSTVCRFRDIECNRCSHERQSIPTTFQSTGNFHVGSEAVIDKLRLNQFLGRNAGDVGIEINNVVDGLVSSCTVYDSYSICFTHNNYSGLLNEEMQVLRHENCRAIRDLLTADDTDVGDNNHGHCKGFGCGPGGIELDPPTSPVHGPLEYINCWYENTNPAHEPSRVAFGGFTFSGAPSRIVMRDCGTIQRFTSAAAGNKTVAAVYIDTIRTDILKLHIDGFKFIVRGTKEPAGGSVFWTGLYLSPHDASAPNAELDLNISNIEVDWSVTSANIGAIRLIELKSGIIRGFISKINIRQINGTTNPHTVYIGSDATTLTIQDRLILRDIDLGESGSGGAVTYAYADNANRRNIMVEGYVPPNRTFAAASAVTLTGSPDTIEHLDFWPANYTIAGGTISAVELSINGGSTWTSLDPTVKFLNLRQADQLRITYSSAPTITKFPIQ